MNGRDSSEEITGVRVVNFSLLLFSKQLKSYYATKMREVGLLSEQIDLVQGRVGKQHYFKQDASSLSKIILELLTRLDETSG